MMNWLQDNPAALAALCTAAGALVLEVIKRWIGKGAEQRADRADARLEITTLNTRIDKLELDLYRVRDLWFESQEENALLRTTMIQHGVAPPPRIQRTN